MLPPGPDVTGDAHGPIEEAVAPREHATAAAPAPEASASAPAETPHQSGAALEAELGARVPVGLPNRGNDCFWLAAVQCLRHTPGFPGALSSALNATDQPEARLANALAKLLLAMRLAEEDGARLLPEEDALHRFREAAMEALPASDGGRQLVQFDAADQRQQDTHEFLSQLLDALGSTLPADDRPPSPRTSSDGDCSRLEVLEKELTVAAELRGADRLSRCLEGHMLHPWVARPGLCDGCGRRVMEGECVMDCRQCNWYLCESCHSQDVGDPESRERARMNVDNILYEYSMVQWAASATRMRSHALGTLFEGQRIASVHCHSCGRYGASGAEPFTVEEVKVGEHHQENGGWFSRLGSWLSGAPAPPTGAPLGELLRESAESPAPEGYRCPNSRCTKVGCSARTMRVLRLPATLVLHVNRVQQDGSRCEIPVEFEPTLDLGRLKLVAHFGHPLDRKLEVCSMRYNLIGAVFHRGATERSGHYFAYVHCGGEWYRVDNDKVTRPTQASEATPMALEASEPACGARVALLFYQRDDT